MVTLKYAPVALAAAIIAALAFVAFAPADADAQSSESRIRVLHASPDAPAVDIYLDGAEAISDLAFDDITDYVSVPSGDHNVQVFPASADGSGDPVIDADVTLSGGTETVALDLPGITLEAGTVYTAFAVGFLDGDPALAAKLTVDATAAAKTEEPHSLPSTGGQPLSKGGSSLSLLLIAGLAAMVVAGATFTFGAAKARNR